MKNMSIAQRHLRFNKYYLQACRVGFPYDLARLFAEKALDLDIQEQ